MSLRTFVELVCQMRHAQKHYFARPRQSTLLEVKRLEKKVDEAIREVAQEYEQARLFPPEPEEAPERTYDPREVHMQLTKAAAYSTAQARRTTRNSESTPSVDERQEQRHR
jgi:hypothetical protein